MLTAYTDYRRLHAEHIPTVPKEIAESVHRIALQPEEVLDKLENCFHDLLNLSELKISSSDVEGYIVPFLKLNPHIDTLEISKNLIDGQGLVQLASLDSLTRIDFTDNSIGPNSSLSLKAIAVNKTLESLSIDGTEVDDEDCKILAENKSLRYLGVCKTLMTEDGFEVLKKSSIKSIESDYGVRSLVSEEKCDATEDCGPRVR